MHAFFQFQTLLLPTPAWGRQGHRLMLPWSSSYNTYCGVYVFILLGEQKGPELSVDETFYLITTFKQQFKLNKK